MNVFDFDETIYYGDSTRDFIFWCFRHYPKTLLYLPLIGYASVRYYTFRIGTKTEFKEKMYRFLKAIKGVEDVERFWKEKFSGIKPFYRQIHRDDDVIVSASPEFLLKPLEDKLHITVIASKVDIRTGKYDGLNCYHAEKVKRFREKYPDGKIESFYSDSYSDEPLALLAEKAYIVDGDTLIEWDYNQHKKHLRT
ncbi:MAG: HAD-IB family phosphatase [Ruminococcus sp.]|uniref:HAD-IB family phosphatase n=1 Tax=Ruminococcus sp. TaxID=41978 RepID=UPI0028737E33|nr:HAD-IB family phosphatase [Ruminococcus sp.]MBQ3284094.1 HAD-IB family phosphatase [Ruminococcus sp.]